MKTAETFNNDCLISFVLNCAVGCGWMYVAPAFFPLLFLSGKLSYSGEDTAMSNVSCRWTMQQRTKIRERYGIKGSTVNDCCVAYWCPCCSTVQNDKEVVSRTKGVIADGYMPQAGMQVKPQ